MDEWETGKQRLTSLVEKMAPGVTVVIPVRPTSGMFLIALARGKAKKFISVPEDDLIDLVDDHAIEIEILDKVKAALSELAAPK